MQNSTTQRPAAKPTKPYPDFPLFPHATRRWAKKIKQRLHYFGPVTNGGDRGAQAALELYLEQRDDLHAGRTPRKQRGGLTIADLANRFLSSKQAARHAGEIVPRTFADYYATCKLLVDQFGKHRLVEDLAGDDFERLRRAMQKTWGPVRVSNEIGRVRVVFKYADDMGLIDRRVRFGPGFKRSSRRLLRKARNGNGPKMFEPDEILALLEAAGVQLRAMILLGVNCGLGNSDCAKLPRSALDLKAGWLNYPKPKTGIERRCRVWPETIAALRAAIAQRPKPRDKKLDDLVFITAKGGSWAKDTSDSPISKEFAKLLRCPRCRRCGRIENSPAEKCSGCGWKPYGTENWSRLYRRGVGFYALRHTFETIGGDGRDQVAVDTITGRAADSRDMSAVYRERIDDSRLQAVVDYVHDWLFGASENK